MRVFTHYEEWEDWAHGLYATVPVEARGELVADAAKLLASPSALGAAMREVVEEWPISSMVNLSDRGSNRRAWLGQAAACYARGVPEDLTREAWGILTPSQRTAANAAADSVIAYWDSGGLGCQRSIWNTTS